MINNFTRNCNDFFWSVGGRLRWRATFSLAFQWTNWLRILRGFSLRHWFVEHENKKNICRWYANKKQLGKERERAPPSPYFLRFRFSMDRLVAHFTGSLYITDSWNMGYFWLRGHPRYMKLQKWSSCFKNGN